VIYKTNIAASHAAGRWQQLHDPELLEKRPYQKLMKLDAPIGAEMAAALRPALLAEQAQAFAAFVDTTLADKVRGKMMIVGALKPDWVSAAEQVGVRPATAEIAVRDKDVWHTFRDAKTAQVNLAWYKNLPRHLGTPGAVVLDSTHLGAPAFLLIYDAGSAAAKLVVRINFQIKKAGTMNIVETGQMVDLSGVRAMVGHGYEHIEGSL